LGQVGNMAQGFLNFLEKGKSPVRFFQRGRNL
jgi:hypothetical protein